MLTAFVLNKASLPTGYMLGNNAEGEWLVVCKLSGVQSIFIADTTDIGAQDSKSSDSHHATEVSESCLISLSATLALLDISLPRRDVNTKNPQRPLPDVMNGPSNWQAKRPIRAPPKQFS